MKLSEIFVYITPETISRNKDLMTSKKESMSRAKMIPDEHQQIRDEVIASLYKAKTSAEITKANNVINRYVEKPTGTKAYS